MTNSITITHSTLEVYFFTEKCPCPSVDAKGCPTCVCSHTGITSTIILRERPIVFMVGGIWKQVVSDLGYLISTDIVLLVSCHILLSIM